MPADYRLIQSQYDMPKFNLAGGFNQGMLGNELIKSTNDPVMQAYARMSPVEALKMRQQNYLKSRSGKKSVFKEKLAAGQSEGARTVFEKWKQVLEQAVQVRVDNPKANISPFLKEAAALEVEFQMASGRPMPTSMSSKMVNELAKDRRYTEKENDDENVAVNRVVDAVIKETNEVLKKYRIGATSLSDAIDLMKTSMTTGKLNKPNATKIASAIKMYVRSLDNSVVNQGEIEGISGGNIMDKIIAFANDLTEGVSYSADQLTAYWDAMMQAADSANQLIDKQRAQIESQARTLLEFAVESGKITADKAKVYLPKINALLRSKMNGYKIGIQSKKEGEEGKYYIPDAPDFQEVEMLPAASSGGGGGGGGGNPLADVVF